MKRKPFALTIILALLFSVVTASSFVRFGEANWLTPTYQEIPDAPILIIDLPVHNETQNTSDVDLDFTVYVEGWNAYYSHNLSWIGYSLDEKPYVWFVGSSGTPQTDNNGLTAFHFSFELTGLTDGIHSLTASAQYIGKYSPAPYEVKNFSVIGYSQKIFFSINTQAIPEFPFWIILPLFVIATLAVIIYRNRLRRKVC